ncbi:MAG TPA: hypothetical protein VHO23_02230 [Candidatus Paceibacterota bacterium]|nr:hypothetical protein [Candidatus Paceibacterota bacterium]
MEPLARLFGSSARLKLLRLFLFNDDAAFSAADAAFRTKVAKDAARKELTALVTIGVVRKRAGKGPVAYAANRRFAHYEPLKAFLRDTSDVRDGDVIDTLRRGGMLRLVVLSGLFTGAVESKVDMLIVGDRLDEKKLAGAVHALEAELGRELRYACFSTEEFKYRRGVYDRLIRDVFDYPNRAVLDRLGLTSSASSSSD